MVNRPGLYGIDKTIILQYFPYETKAACGGRGGGDARRMQKVARGIELFRAKGAHGKRGGLRRRRRRGRSLLSVFYKIYSFLKQAMFFACLYTYTYKRQVYSRSTQK